jgi:hypothetical protein
MKLSTRSLLILAAPLLLDTDMTNGPIKRSKTPIHLTAKQGTASSKQTRKMARNFASMSRQPLTKQHTSDAWNERQRRLSAARDAAKLHLMASYKRGAGR